MADNDELMSDAASPVAIAPVVAAPPAVNWAALNKMVDRLEEDVNTVTEDFHQLKMKHWLLKDRYHSLVGRYNRLQANFASVSE